MDSFLKYLEDTFTDNHSLTISDIKTLKRKWDQVEEFSDCDEEELIRVTEKAENEYKRQRINSKERDVNELKQNDKCYSCSYCGNTYTQINNLKRHMKSHNTNFRCDCGKTYSRNDVLNKHRKTCHTYTLENTRHCFQCKHCGISFDTYEYLFEHVNANHPLTQVGGRVERQSVQGDILHEGKENEGEHNHSPDVIERSTPKKRKKYSFKRKKKERITHKTSALNESVQVIEIIPQESEKYDVLQFFANVKNDVQEELKKSREKTRNIKWYLNTKVKFMKNVDDGRSESINSHFRSNNFVSLQEEDETSDINKALQKMNQSLEEFVHQGSNWILDGVQSMELFVVQYSPISGSSYMELPSKIRFNRGIVNIQNDDRKCFLWSVLASLHETGRNPQNVSNYKRYEGELNMNGIDYPVSLSKIAKFEKQNNISVNVFGFEEGQIFPLYLSKLSNGCREVDLLYLSDERNQHYCWIKDLDKFLRLANKHNRHYHCRRCLYGFTKKSLLDAHRPYCDKADFQKVKFPERGRDEIEFKNFHKQIRIGFAIYADFECINKKVNTRVSQTCSHLVEFEACGYSYQIICTNDKYTKPPVVYRGENAVDNFIENLFKEEEWIKGILKDPEPLIMSEEAENHFQKELKCYICNRNFNESLIKVRDHDHLGLTGDKNSLNYTNYRGASCQRCNLNLQNPSFIPIIMHNLRGFDSHLILSAIGKHKKDVKVIPNTMEKYISFQVDNLRFLDSYQFMSSSLEALIDNLAQDGLKYFKNFKKAFPDENVAKLLLRKNVYCYDYIDSHEKFKETSLPSKEAFYNRLKEEHISDSDYQHVQEVWDTLKMKTLGDLHDNYVKCDAVLLADVVERFRDMCIENYSLDCLHYYTSPGLSYDAALKMTGVCLDLITDPMMYSLFEQQTRGGISVVTQKYAVANNSNVEDIYNPNEPNKYIMYFDANNLYGYAMSQPLPTGYMRFLEDDELRSFDVQNIPSDGLTGYVLEVDLQYPHHLHDAHNDYPLAPTHVTVTDEELSPHSRLLWDELMKHEFENSENITQRKKVSSRTKVSKLIPTLHDKKNYILHYETLKLYLELGLIVTKIHKVIEFEQRPWLKTYIDFNSKKRSQAKNDFEKDFYKLMCNSVYGKTMENVRERIDVKLVSSPKKLKKLVAKPSFKRLKIFNQDLVGVEMKRVTIELNRPAYLGAQILDISKNLMTSFHHKVMKPKYKENISLLFTDTDSLCYEIVTSDVYKDMGDMKEYFDTSNYPVNHHLFSTNLKKVPGKFKDECNGIPIKEFIGLRPKTYSILRKDNNEKLTTKGITKTVKNSQLRHESFRKCLFNNVPTKHDMKIIRSESHQLYIDNVCKKGLSNFDDKRYWLGVKSLAFGHYKINSDT